MPDERRTARHHGPPVTLNRHVLFTLHGTTYAAVVHEVHDDNTVNLTFFTDQGPKVETSVLFDAEGESMSWRWPDRS